MSRALDKERDELVVVMREISAMLAYLVQELARREPVVVHQTVHGNVGQLAGLDLVNHHLPEPGKMVSRARGPQPAQSLTQFS